MPFIRIAITIRPTENTKAVGNVAGSLTPCPNSIEASRPVRIRT